MSPTSVAIGLRSGPPRRLQSSEVQYRLLDPRDSRDALLEEAHRLWRDVWMAAVVDVGERWHGHSDDFTRQDQLGVLVQGGRCIAASGLRWLDLAQAMDREDSYFQTWPANVLETLKGRRVCVASNAVVHPDLRGALIDPASAGSREPVRLAFALIALTVLRTLESTADGFLAMSRNNRSMNRVAFDLGATKLDQITTYGSACDLLYIPRADAAPANAVVAELWERRALHAPGG